MNDYEVKLLPSAEGDLADIWLRSPDPVAVSRAGATTDQMLCRDPLGTGALVVEDLYRLTVMPLIFYYAVDVGQKLVEVSVIREVRS